MNCLMARPDILPGTRYNNAPVITDTRTRIGGAYTIDSAILAQRVERFRVREIMRTELDNSGVLSMDDYLKLCARIGNPPNRLKDNGYRFELFSLFGVRALPHVFPNIRPVHFAVEPSTNTKAMIEPKGHTFMPSDINGVSIEDIIAYTAFGIQNKPGKDGQQQHIAAASGACYRTSRKGLLFLLTTHPQLRSHGLMRRIEPANRLAVPKDGDSYPRIERLADGHSIAALSFMEDTTPMELLIDPTIAQVDLTNYYDMEITKIPQKDVPNYMRLRYSSTPNALVKLSKPWAVSSTIC